MEQKPSKDAGRQIGNYSFKFADKLGAGAYGTVFKGMDTTTGKAVAIKVLDKELLKDDYMRKSLINEIDNMKRVNHPHVVQFITMLHTSHNIYLVCEYCNGGSLQRYIESKGGRLSEQKAIQVLREVVKGYQELYKNNIIHRDLKPENVLIGDGICKLADFGFSRTLQNYKDEKLFSFVGSPLFMAPQILKKHYYSNKCDIWSMGIMGYMLVYGRSPWPAKNIFELLSAVERQPLTFPESTQISEVYRNFLTRCLQIGEDQRMTWEELFSHPLFTEPSPTNASPISNAMNIEHDSSNIPNTSNNLGFTNLTGNNQFVPAPTFNMGILQPTPSNLQSYDYH
eukprot:TRINITY_DN13651_c0_g1_i4.p1 TRINITY_DN13651_c0_g1~~TRINITY_DN13651_c0_g1_i4.p1  ORF type:complete len:340 (-),score=29.48 TRINITY_DN13651_c0_g1_i4:119-1138(-)